MLAKHLFPISFLAVLATSSPVARDTNDDAPLLTAISKDPDLSIFYSLFNSTGGTSGTPGPAFEERFNKLADGRKFTAFAPVNSAFKNLSQEQSAALVTPASYSLLEFILRSHIAEGSLTTEDVQTAGKSVPSIEGVPLKFSSAGDTISINNQATLVSPSRTAVGNGAIFKINSVLDSFVELFGSDVNNSTSNAPTSPATGDQEPRNDGTILSALTSSPNLSTYVDFLNATSPEFFYLLDGSLAQDKNLSIFAPSNAAFQAMGQTAKSLQPSNQPLSSYLLKYGFVETTPAGMDMSIVGFPAKVARSSDGSITSVNNAAVKGEKYCVGNACVYTVDRWLDPIFAGSLSVSGAGSGSGSGSSANNSSALVAEPIVEHSGSNPASHCC